MSTPLSKIFICSGVRLNNRYTDTIWFGSSNEQQGYFAGKVVATFSAYSYLRRTWNIKVQASMAEAEGWNYLYFQNTGFPEHYYYYFINQIEYVNDNTVELFLEMDVMQTYLLRHTLEPCFVERQHAYNDAVGRHTLDEGLELGELVTNQLADETPLSELCILVLSSIYLNGESAETTENVFGGSYNNSFSGLQLFAISMDKWAEWGSQLKNLSSWGKIDGIVGMWCYPKELVELYELESWDKATPLAKGVVGVKEYDTSDHSYFGVLNGYIPKNNKMYTYPYNFLYVSNNNGGSANYRYERFRERKPKFKVVGALAPDAGLKLCPIDYNVDNAKDDEGHYIIKDTLIFEEGLTHPAFPSCAWNADVYKIWLAQNQNAHDTAMTQAVITAAVGGVTALASGFTGNIGGVVGGAGGIYAGITQVESLLAQKRDMAIQPPQARGSMSGNVNIASEKALFTFYNKTVSYENAAIIDYYFTMYGYKMNVVTYPNRHARAAFTYLKTVGARISGVMGTGKYDGEERSVPTEAARKICDIYDAGITFWVDGDKIGDYFQPNTPLGGS